MAATKKCEARKQFNACRKIYSNAWKMFQKEQATSPISVLELNSSVRIRSVIEAVSNKVKSNPGRKACG